ncbi:sulfatase-like hydrolase/transferase [Haloferula chungangensis]|uniref:Sulfatase-like hydrolase/transferase n=1 Tax=Haloferula chungangensis TaxID=1048331 RepID=A0ABW2L5Z0_9BACT
MNITSAALAVICLVSLFRLDGKEAPSEAPPGVSIRRDVSFLAPGREEKLDLYEPSERPDGSKLPAVVIIHGGGWVNGDKGRVREYVTGTSLAKAGYLCISINYELKAGKRWPNNLHDCKNAVRWLRVNADKLGVDPERIGVIGGSAGGHLALMVAYTGDDERLSPKQPYPGVSDKVGACVDMYGITNLLTRRETEKDGTPNEVLKGHRLFPESREEMPEKWRLASPVNHVDKNSPPTLIYHGTADEVVDRDQSKELHDVLQAAGVDSTLRMIKGAGHAWPLRTKDFDLTGEVIEFFNKSLNKPVREVGKVKTDRPNVLFISVDDLNDWEGALGGNCQAKTPHMDRLFAQGTLFTNAHCSQAVCNASRNSLLSGIHPSSSGWYGSTTAMRKSYDRVMGDHKMLPQHFKDDGYRTMAVGKVFHQGVSDYGDKTADFWDETGPKYKVKGELLKRGGGYGGKHFYPFPKEGSQISNHYGKSHSDGNSLCAGPLDREDMPDGKMFDEIISEWAIEKLNEEHEKPFFLAVGFVRPHVPFTAPREFFDLYDPAKIEVPKVPEKEMSDIPLMGKSIAYGTIKGGDHFAVVNLSDRYWKELVHGYLACVSFVDAEIGKVISALEKSPYADNTIVVLWSDHGQHLGEKNHWRKQSLWEEATRVPLFFKAPGSRAAKCDEVVSLLDVYPTLVDLCDLPKAPKLEGESLLPLIKDPASKRSRPVLNTWYYGNHAIRSNDWRYIRYRDGSEELYDHRNDPGEHVNLAANPEFASVIEEHKKWLPKKEVLPAGTKEWKPDKLDRRVDDWKASGSIPGWLK